MAPRRRSTIPGTTARQTWKVPPAWTRHHPPPVRVGDVLDIGETDDAGEVDRALDRSEIAGDCAGDPGDRRRVGHVQRVGGGDPAGAEDRIDGPSRRGFVDIGDRDRIARPGRARSRSGGRCRCRRR